MKKKNVFLIIALGFLFSFLQTPVQAEQTKEKKELIERADKYFSTNLNQLKGKITALEKSKKQTVTFEDIKVLINSYYKDNPMPQEIDESNLSMKDIYPEDVASSKNRRNTLVVNDIMKEKNIIT
ncbi:hypothetical protein SAMN05216389_10737 [Oceanobacillus limi]|uniref:Uncharacterized protein n=1 Tax=Oceanobacillus limi TaxID=930131 RepID=A0A1I0CRJ4_9BACI|nr:hypothetical protein [Oceanobacillus limi]SET22158.1 hypothetical protein SAMN05216389_10737 [Oceanobacillus limi]